MKKYNKSKHIKKVNQLNEIRYLETKGSETIEDLDLIEDELVFEGIHNTSKDNIKKSWKAFVEVAKREGSETVVAAKILKKILIGNKPTPEEIKYLKGQTLDLVKIVGIMGMGVVSMAIPIALEKILNKWDISIMPKEQNM